MEMFKKLFAKKSVAEVEKPVVLKAQETTLTPKEKPKTDEELKQEREERFVQGQKEREEEKAKEKVNSAKTEFAKSDWGIRNTEKKLKSAEEFLEAMKLTGKNTLTGEEVDKFMQEHAVGSSSIGQLQEFSEKGDAQKFIRALMEMSKRDLSASQEQRAKCLRIIRESGDNRTEGELLRDLEITDRSGQYGPYIVTDRGVDL